MTPIQSGFKTETSAGSLATLAQKEHLRALPSHLFRAFGIMSPTPSMAPARARRFILTEL